MTFFAVIHGKCDAQMADAAKITLKVEFHREVLRRLLLDIEDVWMAVIAV